MKPKLAFVDIKLKKIIKKNLYRKMIHGQVNGPYITINRKKLVNLCSNDYLGIPISHIPNKQLQSSSRLVSGNDILFKNLEKKL